MPDIRSLGSRLSQVARTPVVNVFFNTIIASCLYYYYYRYQEAQWFSGTKEDLMENVTENYQLTYCSPPST